jgi:hypothetical protein
MPRVLLPFLSGVAMIGLVACGSHKSGVSGSGASHASTPGAVLDRIDLAKSAASLETLKSFRFDVSMKIDFAGGSSASSSQDALGAGLASALFGALGDIKASGAVVAPDQVDVRLSLFGQDFGYVQIGDKAWEKKGANWEPTDAADSGFDFKPEDLFKDFLPDQVLKVAKTSSETVNGFKATRYSFDKKALEQLVGDLGQQADFTSVDSATLDIWLTADDIPAKVSMDVSGKADAGQKVSLKLEMNIYGINDPSIKIKPPV